MSKFPKARGLVCRLCEGKGTINDSREGEVIVTDNSGSTRCAGCVVVWRDVIFTDNSGSTWFAGCVKGRWLSRTTVAVPGLQVMWRGGNCHWQQWPDLVCRLCGCVKGGNRHWQQWPYLVCRLCGCVNGGNRHWQQWPYLVCRLCEGR